MTDTSNPFKGTGESAAGLQSSGKWLVLRSFKNSAGEDAAALSIKQSDGTYRDVEIAGLVKTAKLRFSQGNKEKEIPPQWEFVLTIVAVDENGVESTEFGIPGRYSTYNLSIGMSRHRALFNLLNILVAAIENEQWDNYIALRGYMSSAGAMMLYANTKRGKDKPEIKYPFDEEQKCFTGVPNAIPTGVFMNGKEIYDNHKRQNFMLTMAKSVVIALGSTDGLDIQPMLSAKGYQENGVPFGAQDQTPPAQSKPSSAQPQPQPQPQPPAQDAVKPAEKFWEALKKNLAKVTNVDSATTLYNAILSGEKSKPELYGVSEIDLQWEVLTHLRNVVGESEGTSFNFRDGKFMIEQQSDDLPF